MNTISYKESKTTDARKSKIIHYYMTPWGSETLNPKGNSVKAIYANFIRQIEPNFDSSKSIVEAVHDKKERETILRQIESINRKIKSELSIAKKQELALERHMLERTFDPGVVLLAKKSRKVREVEAFSKLSKQDQDKVIADHKRRQKKEDDLITVILPTIRNGK